MIPSSCAARTFLVAMTSLMSFCFFICSSSCSFFTFCSNFCPKLTFIICSSDLSVGVPCCGGGVLWGFCAGGGGCGFCEVGGGCGCCGGGEGRPARGGGGGLAPLAGGVGPVAGAVGCCGCCGCCGVGEAAGESPAFFFSSTMVVRARMASGTFHPALVRACLISDSENSSPMKICCSFDIYRYNTSRYRWEISDISPWNIR